MDEQSVWKKEISFRRKPKEKSAPPEPGAEATSVWKKEISFKRKPKEQAATTTPAGEKQSIWKKEITLGRKPVANVDVAPEPAPEPVVVDAEPVVVPEVAAEVVAPAPVVEPEPAPVAVPVVEEPVAVEEPWEAPAEVPPAPEPEPAPVVHPPVPAAELPPLPREKSVPFWKKEISLGGKKPKAEPAPVAAPTVAASDLPSPSSEKPVPFWKKEISVGGKKPKAEKAPKEKKEKAPKAEKQPKQKKEKAPKVKADRGSRGGKKVVGLKIGASQLAAARVSNNGVAELLQVAREPLSAGIVVGGELRDPEALAAALKDFFAKHKLPKKGVRLGLANNRIGVRTFEVAGVEDEKQLDNAIKFRAQEALPIPIDEAVLDFQVLGETTNDEGEQVRRVLLVVAYREQVDRYLEACKKAGITLMGIDLEGFALLRALQAPQTGAGSDAEAAFVAVAIGHERSTFAVSDGRVCEFTRVLEWGGSAVNVALARALDAAPSEVEGVKRALSLEDEAAPEGMSADDAAKARDAIRKSIQAFARELVSSLQFYQNQPGSLGIGEIVLTGGTTHLPGLSSELERLIGVHVRVGDPLNRMKVSKKLGEPEQVGSLAVAIGLGIED